MIAIPLHPLAFEEADEACVAPKVLARVASTTRTMASVRRLASNALSTWLRPPVDGDGWAVQPLVSVPHFTVGR